jgi:hypothetical protein
MIEDKKRAQSENEDGRSHASRPEPAFPSEPFACPACGQMLAPTCRVCVACKQPISPAECGRLQAVAAPAGTLQPLACPSPVRFSWRTFLIVFGIWLIVATVVQRLLGPIKSQLALAGVQILSSLWVFYDAQERGVPKALRWGLGSLLLWPIVFPWYLARRSVPQAPCPFVEAPVNPITRALLIVLLVVIFLLILKGPAPK